MNNLNKVNCKKKFDLENKTKYDRELILISSNKFDFITVNNNDDDQQTDDIVPF